MILQFQRILGRLRDVFREFPMHGRPHRLAMILYQHAIVKNRNERRLHQFFALESRRFEHDVVSLPFARLS